MLSWWGRTRWARFGIGGLGGTGARDSWTELWHGYLALGGWVVCGAVSTWSCVRLRKLTTDGDYASSIGLLGRGFP